MCYLLLMAGLPAHAQMTLGQPSLDEAKVQVWCATARFVYEDAGRPNLKRTLRDKFPDESTKGTTFYSVLRLMQLRWLRMPKPKVKLGGAPRSRCDRVPQPIA